MMNIKLTAILTAITLVASTTAWIPTAKATPIELCLTGGDVTPIDLLFPYSNDLTPCPPTDELAVFELDTGPGLALWSSAPLAEAELLLPGPVTLDLLDKNYAENEPGLDICWEKHVVLPDGSVVPIVPLTCFENPFPAVGPGTCPASIVVAGSQPPPAGCAPQGLLSMTAPSLLVAALLVPAGSVVAVSIFCPGSSFQGAFFDGTFDGKFSKISEPEAPRAEEGRMTGGGSVTDPTGIPTTKVTHGFELHCDETVGPNNLEVNWDKGDNFHLDTLTTATCIDDPGISEVPPVAGFDTYVGMGTGTCNGVPGATATWVFTDAGEPGTADSIKMIILGCPGFPLLAVSGTLSVGNHQAHT